MNRFMLWSGRGWLGLLPTAGLATVLFASMAGASPPASTTISAASDGVDLPTSTISVVSTTGFTTVGTILVTTSTGPQTVTYTGITATTFTGLGGGTGTLSTGNAVVQLDLEDPVVTPPGDVVEEATSPSGAVVSFGSGSATDNVGVTSGPTCLPASGSLFPIDVTTVTCSASDAAGNEGQATFTVTVDDPGGVVRYQGGNRFATAAAVAVGDFPVDDSVTVVFIAVGSNFPDALAGAAVAGKFGAPLLLVNTASIPVETAAELTRLSPDTIVVLGGEGVISPAVALELLGYAPAVIRLSGGNRYQTAVAISQYGFPGVASEVIVATGTAFADALAAGPAAVALNAPVLLTPPDVLPQAVIDEVTRLAPDRIVVVGGTAAVSDVVFDQLEAIQANTVRIWGANRYETAVAISQDAFPGGAARGYVATGLNFPDALAGAAAAGWWGGPILSVPRSSLPENTSGEITRLGVTKVIIVGGTSAVSAGVQTSLENLLGI